MVLFIIQFFFFVGFSLQYMILVLKVQEAEVSAYLNSPP